MFEIEGTTEFCRDVVIQKAITPVTREKVMELEAAIATLPDQIDIDSITAHHFADGVYLREIFLPAGTVITGKIHRTKHLTIICNGTVRITTDRGVEEISGPAVFVTEAGAKKAAYAVTDCTIMNPHPTEETDVVKIEEQFIAPSFEALESDTRSLEVMK